LTLYRVLPLNPRAGVEERGGVLWWPRELQGAGRHDNPDLYGCMYVSQSAVAPVAEALAPFRSTGRLLPEMLVRGGFTLALAALAFDGAEALLDLDDPEVLTAEALRPSAIATRDRSVTQAMAADLFRRHPRGSGLRWWSTLEAAWLNVTLFDRAAPLLSVHAVTTLGVEDDLVAEAVDLLGLRP